MGYLYLGDLGGEEYATSGNQGLLDICDGLKWVRENIEAFGGDPGERHDLRRKRRRREDLLPVRHAFRPRRTSTRRPSRAVPGIRMMPREAAAETTLMTLKQLGIEKSDWRKLLEVPAEKLVEAQGCARADAEAGRWA